MVRDGVSMLDPIKQKIIGAAEVMEKFGVPPEKVVEVQALMGDSIDNVPGVPGIGPKNAAELIQAYGDVEAVLAAAPAMKASKRRDNLIAFAEAARISRKLVELCDKAPLPLTLESLAGGSTRYAAPGRFSAFDGVPQHGVAAGAGEWPRGCGANLCGSAAGRAVWAGMRRSGVWPR